MKQLNGVIGYTIEDAQVEGNEVLLQLVTNNPLLSDVELAIRAGADGALEVFVHGKGYPNRRRVFPDPT